MSIKQVRQEITSFIADRIDRQEVIELDLIVREVVIARPLIEGADAEFYRICTYQKVHEIAKTCIAKYNAKGQSSPQLSLPGFEHLQVAYTVPRNGVIMLVPVNKMTDEELLERAKEYDDMAKGCRDHAREIRGYVAKRNEANDNMAAEAVAA